MIKLLCITGERETNKFYPLIKRLLLEYKPEKVIFGDCSGVDTDARQICDENKIPYEVFPANWVLHKKAAGPIRNQQMINAKPDLVLAFHSDIKKSRGTRNTILLAKRHNIRYELYSAIE